MLSTFAACRCVLHVVPALVGASRGDIFRELAAAWMQTPHTCTGNASSCKARQRLHSRLGMLSIRQLGPPASLEIAHIPHWQMIQRYTKDSHQPDPDLRHICPISWDFWEGTLGPDGILKIRTRMQTPIASQANASSTLLAMLVAAYRGWLPGFCVHIVQVLVMSAQ